MVLKEGKFDFAHFSNIINVSLSSFPGGFQQYSEFLQQDIYPLMNEDGTVVVTRFAHDGTPWAPKIIGQMVDAHTVRIFDKI